MIELAVKMALFLLPVPLCAQAARGSRGLAWWAVAGLLLLLALNLCLRVELPLGRAVIRGLGLGRPDTGAEPWWALAAALAALAGTGVLLAPAASRLGGPLMIACLGLGLIAAVMAVRGASLHHVDRVLSRRWLIILNPRQAAELAGLLLVAAGALWQVRRRLAEPTPPPFPPPSPPPPS